MPTQRTPLLQRLQRIHHGLLRRFERLWYSLRLPPASLSQVRPAPAAAAA